MGQPTPNREAYLSSETRNAGRRRLDRVQTLALKVPEITIYFWIAKLLTTAMGEATSDYLVFGINKYVAVGLGAVGLAVALILQFSAHRYVAWIYWLAAVMVAIFGTMAADVLHIVILTPVFGSNVAYIISSVLFAVCLIIVFVVWYSIEKTLSIHSITTRRRETFYWATVLATFAMGTAVGDLTAVTLHLGYLSAGLLFIILIELPALAYFLLGLNEIAAFWIAYILTRPLGASFADWFGKPQSLSGLGLGDAIVAVVLTALIIIVVGYLSITRKDIRQEQVAVPTTGSGIPAK